jgi:hypothetical protein
MTAEGRGREPEYGTAGGGRAAGSAEGWPAGPPPWRRRSKKGWEHALVARSDSPGKSGEGREASLADHIALVFILGMVSIDGGATAAREVVTGPNGRIGVEGLSKFSDGHRSTWASKCTKLYFYGQLIIFRLERNEKDP